MKNRAVTAEVDDPDVKKELRIAMTMNGGVSLAVYIGGVAHEFNRLTQRNTDTFRTNDPNTDRKKSPYADLLDAIGYNSPVIDVITGTSAGGINAAALALAQANANSNFAALRDLWIDRGQISDLLREPFHNGAPSLLKGDDYLYPEIRNAFADLVKDYVRSTAASPAGTQDDEVPTDSAERLDPRPVDLTITATLLSPVPAVSVDDLGSKIEQPKHAGLFRFTTKALRKGEPVGDMFAMADESNPEKHSIERTVEALALASRATASFPAAFEPTFVPVNCTGRRPDDRPDMADYVDQEWLDPQNPEADRSRYAVDGGVLANTPLRHALKAIRQQEVSQTLVRRVLILVHPHAVKAGEVVIPADSAESPPTLVSGLAGVLGASSSVGSLSYVEDVHKHNEQALRARDGRLTTLTQLQSPEDVADFLETTWPLIRHLRLRRAAYVMADQIKDTDNVPLAKVADYADALLQDEDRLDRLPFLPKEGPNLTGYRENEWRWGLDLAIGITTLATDLLRSVIVSKRKLPDSGEAERLAMIAWNKAVNGGVELDQLGQDEERRARANIVDVDLSISARARIEGRVMASLDKYHRRMGPPEVTANEDASHAQRPEPSSRLMDLVSDAMRRLRIAQQPVLDAHAEGEEHHGTKVMRILDGVADSLYDVIVELNRMQPSKVTGIGSAAGVSTSRTLASSLLDRTNLLRIAVGNGTSGEAHARGRGRELLCMMHRIELISYSLGERDLADSAHTAPIEFAQLSAQIEQDFADRYTSDDKLAGMSLNRFGAFLKRSWRANDWIWGRLDAIKLMMLLTLTPAVVRGMCQPQPGGLVDNRACAEALADKIIALTAPIDVPTYQCFCKTGALQKLRERAVIQVVEALKGNDAPLTDVCSLAAYGFQIRAAEEDVPWLAETIRDDEAEGGSGFQTTAFLHRIRSLDNRTEKSHTPHGYDLLVLFAESKIGQEALSEQLPTDLVIRTAATAAAATVTALSSDRSGVGVARPLTKGARGLVALPYWVLFGLTQRGQLGRALSAATLAFGVALLALALIGELPGVLATIVPTVGVASLLTILVYAAFRTQSIVHSAALLGLFIPITAFAAYRISVGQDDDPKKSDTATVVLSQNSTAFIILCLALVIGGAILVANMRTQTKTPLRSVREIAVNVFHAVEALLADPWRVGRTLGWAGGIAVLGWLVTWQRDRALRAVDYLQTTSGPQETAIQRHLWSDIAEHPLLALSAVAATAAIGGLVAVVASNRLRPRAVNGRRRLLTDPAGIATAWAPVYGFLYLGLGIVIVVVHSEGPHWWAVASFALSTVFGLFFCLVLVFLIPAQRKRRLIVRLAGRYGPGQMPTADQFKTSELERLGELSNYLTTRDGTELSKRGKRVLQRAQHLHRSKYKNYSEVLNRTTTPSL